MPVELVNPAALPTPQAYAQMAVATGTRTVWISGQVARDADGQPVGAGDLAAQVEQVYRNLAAALAAVGASFADVAQLRAYVVDWETSMFGALLEGVGRVVADLGIDPVRPMTLVGVTALGEPDLLVEVEAVAVLA